MSFFPLAPWLTSIPGLCKLKITVSVAVTTAAGYVLANRSLNLDLVSPAAGVFLLACGSSALNQIQEWRADLLMMRTRMRPIPSMQISLRSACAVSALFSAIGSILLALGGWRPLLLGGLSVFWYNCVYTPLKRCTAFAVIPGALIGAIPPAIGWTAAGGGESMAPLASLCGFLFFWQIPHFWLLALLHSDDYHRAGYPTIGRAISASLMVPSTAFWIALAGIAGITMPVFGMSLWHQPMIWPLLALPCVLTTIALLHIVGQGDSERRLRQAFYAINGLGMIVVAVMVGWALAS